jgi:hypothetical protein
MANNPLEAMIEAVFFPLATLGQLTGEPARYRGGVGQWAGPYQQRSSYRTDPFFRGGRQLTPTPPPVPVTPPVPDQSITPTPPTPPPPDGRGRRQQFGGDRRGQQEYGVIF